MIPKKKLKINFIFKIILFFFICTIFISCDRTHNCTIINNQNKDILIEIVFDKDVFIKYWNGKPFVQFIENYLKDSGCELISFDKINLVSISKIKVSQKFELETSIGNEPNLDIFKKIIIYSDKTLILDSNEKIKKSFQEIEDSQFVLEIKD